MKKRLTALLLAAVMLLSLAACGRQENPDTPENTPAPEMVYVAEYSPIDKQGDSSLSPSLFVDDGFYAEVYEVVGQREATEEDAAVYAAAYGLSPSNAVIDLVEKPEADGSGEAEEPEEGAGEEPALVDVYGYNLYFVSYEGQVSKLEDYTPVVPPENTENYQYYDAGSYLNGMALAPDGELLVLENVYVSYYDGPEGAERYSDEYYEHLQYETSYYIRTLTPQGAEVSSARLEVGEDGYLNTYSIQADSAGNLLIPYDEGTGNYEVRAYAPDGTVAYSVRTEGYTDGLILLGDGRVGVLGWGESAPVLNLVEDGKLGESYELPNNAFDLISGDGRYDLYYTSGIDFYGYDLETGTQERILNWINCDVDSGSMSRVHVCPDGSILSVINTYNDGDGTVTSELVTVKQVPYDSVPHKTSLTMAVMYLAYDLRQAIINFNRKNDSVHIDVTDYSQYDTGEDGSAGQTKLTTEIMAGKLPDLLYLDGLPYTQLAAKGLLEDIYPYLDKDQELSREDFFPNVLSALEVNGGLYQICPGFSVMTAIGAKSVVGDTPGWTFAQYEEALASMPQGCEPFEYYTTKEDILSSCLAMDMDSFVDWTTGQCHFDSQAFIDLLEFANQFPAEFDWDNYEYTDEDDVMNRIAQGRQMLMRVNVYSFRDVQFNDGYFGGDGTMTYIGYPTNSGVGNALSLSSGYAISAKCKDKDAAWSFLRQFLTEDYQKDQYQLPTNRRVYETRLKEAMTPQYLRDGQGNFLLDENGEKIKESQGTIQLPDGSSYEIYELSQAQADALTALIESTDKIYETNAGIYDIVREESQAFFAGQKTAADVAKLIQSKVYIYINEQR